jgi:hypothetical protein
MNSPVQPEWLKILGAGLCLLLALAPFAVGQTGLAPVSTEEIIRRFSEKEEEFKLARTRYTFRQQVRVQELDARGDTQYDLKGNVLEFRSLIDVLFDDKGRRVEKELEKSTRLERLRMTKEDFEDMRSVQPFVLSTPDLPKYVVTFAGRESVDEMPCIVFNVAPRRIEKDQRYFEGKVWVHAEDHQIIKTFGKAVPDLWNDPTRENLFPRFETYRQKIDGKYWFPTYTIANDTLQFSQGAIRVRWIIRYENYRQFLSEVNVVPLDKQ